MTTDDDTQAVLARLGITVPAEDLPFLRRARSRQSDLLDEWSASLPPDTEPALVFRPQK